MEKYKRIEMLGLPGAGKTTLQQCLYGSEEIELKIAGPIKVTLYHSIFNAILLFIKMTWHSPRNSYRFLFDRQSRRLLLKLGLRIAADKVRSKQQVNNNMLFVDSGMLMPLISAVVEEGWKPRIRLIQLIIKSIELPDLLLFIDVGYSAALERYKKRENLSSYNEMNFVTGDNTCHSLIQELSGNGVRVLTISNNNEINCNEIISGISKNLMD